MKKINNAEGAPAHDVGAESKIFRFDFGAGKLVPVSQQALPIGAVLAYEDRANPRQLFAVVGYRGGQNVLLAEDGHESSVYAGSVRAKGERGGGFEDQGRVLGAEELEEFKLNAAAQKAMDEAAAKAEKEKAEAAFAEGKAKAEAEGKALGLVPVPAQGNALAMASKNLKRELQARFPGVKFAVKSSRFSGGDSLSVSYRNGPPWAVVDAIGQKYKAGYFDGMEDLYHYGRGPWAHVFGDAKYVSVSRQFGRDHHEEDEIHRRLAARVMALAEAKDEQEFRGKWSRWPADMVREALNAAPIPPGWEIRGIDWRQREAGPVFKLVIGLERGAK